MSATIQTQTKPRPLISCDQALRSAQSDAERVYRDLTPYEIKVVLLDDGWHIDYELRNPRMHGGGPHYIIDAESGIIQTKRYEQ